MRVKKSLAVIVLVLSTFSFFTSTIYAAEHVGITNTLELGFISVRVEDGMRTRGGITTVLPGDVIHSPKVIHNVGSPCYIRASIAFTNVKALNESHLYGMPDKWEKKSDGYYYYKDVVNTGDRIELYQGFTVPDTLSQGAYEETFFSVIASVDAIQSKNFQPQYEESKPWGEVQVVKSVVDEGVDINTLKKPDTQTLEILYPEDMSGLVANQSDFFKNFPYMMPGDTYSDTLTVKNESKEPIDLYFKTENPSGTKLLDDVSLEITSNIKGEEELVYKGNLKAVSLSDGVNLGTVEGEEEKQIVFEVGIPATVTNEFSVESSGVKWRFSTSPIVDELPPDDGSLSPDTGNGKDENKEDASDNGSIGNGDGNNGSGNNNPSSAGTSNVQITENVTIKKEEVTVYSVGNRPVPNTGDGMRFIISIILMIISMFGIIWALRSLSKYSSVRTPHCRK